MSKVEILVFLIKKIDLCEFVLYAVRSVIQFAKVSLHVQALIELTKA